MTAWRSDGGHQGHSVREQRQRLPHRGWQDPPAP
nr:MAG TPA: hypothetical protein [Caudoviricetes sp.]